MIFTVVSLDPEVEGASDDEQKPLRLRNVRICNFETFPRICLSILSLKNRKRKVNRIPGSQAVSIPYPSLSAGSVSYGIVD
jgi:hypothetical protein